jgi:hypothetical protein
MKKFARIQHPSLLFLSVKRFVGKGISMTGGAQIKPPLCWKLNSFKEREGITLKRRNVLIQ